jgi:hypothetical protein
MRRSLGNAGNIVDGAYLPQLVTADGAGGEMQHSELTDTATAVNALAMPFFLSGDADNRQADGFVGRAVRSLGSHV